MESAGQRGDFSTDMGRFKNILVCATAAFLSVSAAFAQTDRREVRSGNRDFKKENYKEAQIDYSRALVKDSTSFAANYNLGNTLYRQGDMEQAKKSFDVLGAGQSSEANVASLNYNRGNAAATLEDWQGALDAYKQALLLNPDDIDAKENYIYAKGKLDDQQNDDQNQNQDQNQDQNDDQSQDQNQNQDQNNDQNHDQNNDQNDQNQDQNQGQNDQNQDQQNQDQQNQDSQQPQISPQAAQQMLNAMRAKEKDTQDKVNREKAERAKTREKEKYW